MLINKYLNGSLSDSIDNALKRFIGSMHRTQCLQVLNNGYKNVHKQMDAKSTSPYQHRLFGHNKDFISRYKGKEKHAAQLHLTADFIQEILPKVLGLVLEDFKQNKAEPPYYVRIKGQNKGRWDVDENKIDQLIKKLSRDITTGLNKKNKI